MADEDLAASQRYFKHPRPIEFRPVEKITPDNPRNYPPFQHIWLKAKGQLPDTRRVHQEVLAYTVDYHLLGTATLPHRKEYSMGDLFMVSLDHAMWFHRAFRMDEWLLYAMDSPSASNTRGFSRGNLFTRDGLLVASVVQEGLMSPRRKE